MTGALSFLFFAKNVFELYADFFSNKNKLLVLQSLRYTLITILKCIESINKIYLKQNAKQIFVII